MCSSDLACSAGQPVTGETKTPRRSGLAARLHLEVRAVQLFVQPETTGKVLAPFARAIPRRDERRGDDASHDQWPCEPQARSPEEEHQQRDAHHAADEEADDRADDAIEPAERSFVDRLRQQLPPPTEDRRDAETGEDSDQPAQCRENEDRTCALPVHRDHIRDPCTREDARHDAEESENLRECSAQESANQERGDDEEQRPVEPREVRREIQLNQFSCDRRAMFFRLAAFSLRLRRSLGFSKC